ncbi:cysteine desulfurase family protein [Bombella pollinis]|uniref:Cysteine desulfurase n=1 Tax=Bombella pollinis TaxID=2967337 RepID=A0ABT3WMM8_9PROT|nr:aminotransferase class V-fold PLP-dependent enzyme [Bombella pollinis]MCX5620397.1 aminotransferase class V-fold PLP-dependent enzyme [Bombella pollinis]
MLHAPPSQHNPLYLDANATEPLRPIAQQALNEGLAQLGNPASVHTAGRKARVMLEQARKQLAGTFGREADSFVFTSGGTEANTLAVHGFGHAIGRPILIGATEHDAIRKAAPGACVIPVDQNGLIECAALETQLASHAAEAGALVCIMAANNETGVYAPLEDIAALCRQYGAHLHIDAVQAAGRMSGTDPFSQAVASGALVGASLALSAHKMGGVMGAGALLLPEDRPLPPLLPGGGQERGRRGGTPALAAHLSMAAALVESQQQEWSRLQILRDELEAICCHAGAVIMGRDVPRLPNTVSALLPGVAAQMQLMALDIEGYCVSAGSACSSGKVARSHVLEAMGQGEGAGQAIRISLPWNVQAEHVRAFGQAYSRMAQRFAERGLLQNNRTTS